MKRMKYWCLFLTVLLLGGCGQRPHEKQIYAMDTVMTLTVWGDGTAPETLGRFLQDADNQLSVTKEASLVSRLNRGETVTPEDELYRLLQEASQLGAATGGRLDICLYPVTRLWGFTTGQYQIPSEEARKQALSHTGNHQLILENGTARLEPGAQMDLGAVAKGWAGRHCVGLLEENPRVRCALLALGGNIQTYGTKPGNKPWRIGIQEPGGSGLAGLLEITGTWAIVTSGGYQRYFEEQGKVYTHIIDPSDGCPVNNDLASVTVVCKDGLRADGLSTALSVMGLEKAAEFWKKTGDFEAVLIGTDGTIYTTSGLADALTSPNGAVVPLASLGQTD